MIVVCDCGSTKADWVIVSEDNQTSLITSKGFNPFIQDSEWISATVVEALSDFDLKSVSNVYFYGAGCSDDFRCGIVRNALTTIFVHANIQIEHDLIGAARALLGNSAGVACILGTGSNTCLFDGKRIVDQITSLGYLLGDEGSGSHLGKLLIKSYMYRELSDDLVHDFESMYGSDKRSLLNNLYGQQPNVYLATFSTFYSKYQNHPFINLLIQTAFRELVEKHILKYKGVNDLPISFVGSIAFNFEKQLKEVLSAYNLKAGIVIQKPINNLVNFHIDSK